MFPNPGPKDKPPHQNHHSKLATNTDEFPVAGSSSLDSGSDGGGSGPEPFKRSLSARDSRAGSSAAGNKVFPKLGKLGGTIEEDAEGGGKEAPGPGQALAIQDSKQLQMRRLESYDGGLIVQSSHEREILAAVLEVRRPGSADKGRESLGRRNRAPRLLGISMRLLLIDPVRAF